MRFCVFYVLPNYLGFPIEGLLGPPRASGRASGRGEAKLGMVLGWARGGGGGLVRVAGVGGCDVFLVCFPKLNII